MTSEKSSYMRSDGMANFLDNPDARKIRINGKYHHLPGLEFHHGFIPMETVNNNNDDEETPFPAPDTYVDVARLSAGINLILKSFLTEREQIVIRNSFFTNMTLAEIGKIIGLSQERTRQIRSRALYKVRETIPAQALHSLL